MVSSKVFLQTEKHTSMVYKIVLMPTL